MSALAGDQARASVFVAVEPARAFQVFSEEIDLWWRRGLKYRIAGKNRGIICLEPRLGGRLFESFENEAGAHVAETGRITAWDPPQRFVFEWRAVNFAPTEKTEVEVEFQPRSHGTLVTVTHRGFAKLRPDYPVRHGLEVASFIRMMGMWWGELLTAMREHVQSELDTPA